MQLGVGEGVVGLISLGRGTARVRWRDGRGSSGPMGGEAKTWNLSEQAALQKHCGRNPIRRKSHSYPSRRCRDLLSSGRINRSQIRKAGRGRRFVSRPPRTHNGQKERKTWNEERAEWMDGNCKKKINEVALARGREPSRRRRASERRARV